MHSRCLPGEGQMTGSKSSVHNHAVELAGLSHQHHINFLPAYNWAFSPNWKKNILGRKCKRPRWGRGAYPSVLEYFQSNLNWKLKFRLVIWQKIKLKHSIKICSKGFFWQNYQAISGIYQISYVIFLDDQAYIAWFTSTRKLLCRLKMIKKDLNISWHRKKYRVWVGYQNQIFQSLYNLHVCSFSVFLHVE